MNKFVVVSARGRKSDHETIRQSNNSHHSKKKSSKIQMFRVAVFVAVMFALLRQIRTPILFSELSLSGKELLGETPGPVASKKDGVGTLRVDANSTTIGKDTADHSRQTNADKSASAKGSRVDEEGQAANNKNNNWTTTDIVSLEQEIGSAGGSLEPTSDAVKHKDSLEPSLASIAVNPYPVFADVPARPLSVGILTKFRRFTHTTRYWGDGMEKSKHLNLTVVCALKEDDVDLDNICYHAPVNGSRYGEDDKKIGKLPPPSSVDLWIIDLVRLDYGPYVKHPINKRMLPPFNNDTKVMIIDYRDQPFGRRLPYRQLGIPLKHKSRPNWKNVRVVVGSCIIGRHWNPENNTIHLGKSALNPAMEVGGGPVLHSSYAVRSDVLQAVEELVSHRLNGNTNSNSKNGVVDNVSHHTTSPRTINNSNNTHRHPACEAIYMERPMDVIHLWDPKELTDLQLGFARYRDAVSYKLVEMGNASFAHAKKNTTVIRSSIAIQGMLGEKGRTGVDFRYIHALLNSKIVIATQRDNWEDHYRFMEALSSGAMVMTDYMLSLPQGFVNATNVVMFDSVEQMERLIRYYLAQEMERLEIAKRGVETALGWHRAWHRMEWLVFGKPLTDVGTVGC